jgi:glycosyltransferase involved in cell wall biosynthesis
MKVMVKHVNAFIALSQSSKDIHDQMGLALPIVRIPGFVPDQRTVSSIPNSLVDRISEEPYFLFVGRLKKLKGLQTLIPVFRQYQKAKLLIVGTGEDEPSLRRLAEGMVNIQFLGYLSGPKLEALYRHAIALIVPSICFESFPLVILEAFRTQTPVIARNLGGMPEPIKESGGGFVYNTAEELLAAMDKLLEDPSCRHELGLRGYQTYQRNWTDEVFLERYLDLIHNIARTRGQKLE